LMLVLIVGAIGLLRRRRWAIWWMGGWSIVYFLFALFCTIFSILSYWECLRHKSNIAWWVVSFLSSTSLLPVGTLILLGRTATRGQFHDWTNSSLPTHRPIWPSVIGWLSVFHSARAIAWLVAGIARQVVGSMVEPGHWSGNGLWRLLNNLPLLTAAALIVPAILLLRRRRGAIGLHLACALLVLVALVVGQIILFGFRMPTILSRWFLSQAVLPAIYPLFLLVWFVRPSVWRQVSRWRRPGEACGPAPDGVEDYSRR